MDYAESMKQAYARLHDGSYIDCSFRCGKTAEKALKELIVKYIANSQEGEARVRHLMLALSMPTVDMLTLGQAVQFFNSLNLLSTLSNQNPKDARSLNIQTLCDIRDIAAHGQNSQTAAAAEEHARIIYGCVLKLLRETGLLKIVTSSQC